jgi:hypothetical protein
MPATLAIADLDLALHLPSGGLGVDFLGPTLRGLLGYGLREIACNHGSDRSGRCACPGRCGYAHLFEGTVPSSLGGYATVPQPFRLVVDAPGAAREPDMVRFTVRLFGHRAIALAPLVVDAIDARSRHGIGSRESTYELVHAELGPSRRCVLDPDAAGTRCPRAVDFRFITPTMLRKSQLAAHSVVGDDLLHAGRTRAWLLARSYGEGDCTLRSLQGTGATSLNLVDASVTPWRIRRHSGRQHRAIDLSGVLGRCTVAGDWSSEDWWLRHAAELGVGKYTSFGLGSVECSPRPEPCMPRPRAVTNHVREEPINRRRRARLPRWVQLRGLPPAGRVSVV